MDFSILMPTLSYRKNLFEKALSEVKRQINEIDTAKIEVIYESDNGELTLGAKRNLLISRASGTYCCFIDDDDIISPSYLKTFLPMLEKDYDCASFLGAHYDKGNFNKLFYHSLDVDEWHETSEMYYRTPSPMNMIKTEICRKIQYKDVRHVEDHEFSKRLKDSGLLKNEYKIPNIPIYHYIDGVKSNRNDWTYEWDNNLIKLKNNKRRQFGFFTVR